MPYAKKLNNNFYVLRNDNVKQDIDLLKYQSSDDNDVNGFMETPDVLLTGNVNTRFDNDINFSNAILREVPKNWYQERPKGTYTKKEYLGLKPDINMPKLPDNTDINSYNYGWLRDKLANRPLLKGLFQVTPLGVVFTAGWNISDAVRKRRAKKQAGNIETGEIDINGEIFQYRKVGNNEVEINVDGAWVKASEFQNELKSMPQQTGTNVTAPADEPKSNTLKYVLIGTGGLLALGLIGFLIYKIIKR